MGFLGGLCGVFWVLLGGDLLPPVTGRSWVRWIDDGYEWAKFASEELGGVGIDNRVNAFREGRWVECGVQYHKIEIWKGLNARGCISVPQCQTP